MISAQLISDLQSLVSNVTAAAPLNTQTRILIEALQEQGSSLLAEIDGEMSTDGPILDASDPSGFPGDMVSTLLALAGASEDQTTLADMSGLVGRAMFNLEQASQ